MAQTSSLGGGTGALSLMRQRRGKVSEHSSFFCCRNLWRGGGGNKSGRPPCWFVHMSICPRATAANSEDFWLFSARRALQEVQTSPEPFEWSYVTSTDCYRIWRSKGGRKISHSRTTTDQGLVLDFQCWTWLHFFFFFWKKCNQAAAISFWAVILGSVIDCNSSRKQSAQTPPLMEGETTNLQDPHSLIGLTLPNAAVKWRAFTDCLSNVGSPPEGLQGEI